MTDRSHLVNKTVTLLILKDDMAPVCDTHIPLVEHMEVGVGRDIPKRETLKTPADCEMCLALIFEEGRKDA